MLPFALSYFKIRFMVKSRQTLLKANLTFVPQVSLDAFGVIKMNFACQTRSHQGLPLCQIIQNLSTYR